MDPLPVLKMGKCLTKMGKIKNKGRIRKKKVQDVFMICTNLTKS